jgi:hypothetical protein
MTGEDGVFLGKYSLIFFLPFSGKGSGLTGLIEELSGELLLKLAFLRRRFLAVGVLEMFALEKKIIKLISKRKK